MDKRPLKIGFVLMALASVLATVNNFEGFHKRYDNLWFWNEFNEGTQRIMQGGGKAIHDDFNVPGRNITVDGKATNDSTGRVIRLMDTEPGFKEMRYHIVKNLVIKPDYEINAIINEQTASHGDVNNPYLATRIISLIPVPKDGAKYKSINLKAYLERKDVTTEFFLNEWLKNHRKNTVLYLWVAIFLTGFFLQMVYHIFNK